MPVSFTPDLIPRFDATFLNYINVNMQRLKQSLQNVPKEHIGTAFPTAPYIGQQHFDTINSIWWTYISTGWIVPHALGLLGRASLTANSIAYTAIIYPLSLTITTLASRKICVEMQAHPAVDVVVPTHEAAGICNNSGTLLQQAYCVCTSADVQENIQQKYFYTSIAETLTFKLGVYSGNSSYLTAASNAHNFLAAYDLGPA